MRKRDQKTGRWLKGPPKKPAKAAKEEERDLQGLTQKEAIKYPFSDPEKAKAASLLAIDGKQRLTRAKRLVMEIATGAYREALIVALEEFRTLLWMRDNTSPSKFGVRNRARLIALCEMILKHTEKVLPASLEVSGHLTVAEVPLLPADIITAMWAKYIALKAEKEKALPPPSGPDEEGNGHETESLPAQSRELKSAGQSLAED